MQREYTDLSIEELCDLLCGKPEDDENLSEMIEQEDESNKNFM